MNRIVFLGSGGGRHVMADQSRKTGGLFFELDTEDKQSLKFSLDPGPGALVHAASLGMRHDRWDGVVLSHFHPDHSTDANALLDGMQKPFLIAEQHCLMPPEKLKTKFTEYSPCIFPYHQQKAMPCRDVKDGDIVKIKDVEFRVAKARHDAPTVGYRIVTKSVDVAYAACGSYYAGQERYYSGCKVLILNVLLPKGKTNSAVKHMSVDDAITLVKKMAEKPQLVVFHHLSHLMMRSNLWKQTRIMEEATGVKTIHAEDFMELDLDRLKTTKVRAATQTITPSIIAE